MYLLDTNVISELSKPKPNQGVLDFFDQTADSSLFISAITISELIKGYTLLCQRGKQAKAEQLSKWILDIFSAYESKILAFDAESAFVFGIWMAHSPNDPFDKQIAAIAKVNSLTVVTRNISHFLGFAPNTLNPFV